MTVKNLINASSGRIIVLLVRTAAIIQEICQVIGEGRWFTQGCPVFSAHKPDHACLSEIKLTTTLNTLSIFIYFCRLKALFCEISAILERWLRKYTCPCRYDWIPRPSSFVRQQDSVHINMPDFSQWRIHEWLHSGTTQFG